MSEGGGFAQLAELVRRRAGVAITPDKAQAASHRLAPVARIFGFKSSAALLAELAHPHEELAQAIAEAITPQDTSFFRDPPIFEHFKDHILPVLMSARSDRKRLRIWCAGCATGQEAYSLAMLLEEEGFVAKGWSVDLIATDLSGDALGRAKDGLYSQYEIQRGLPASLRSRYFSHDSDGWRANERLRRVAMFRKFNLIDHFGWLGELDIVFCRNVLIYFEPGEKAAVLDKMTNVLAADGFLVLGAAEGNAHGALPFKPAPGPRGIFLKPPST